ncbi:MAG: glycerophosphodiester phosphodiesterase [Ignavibacteriae bacterium]|nr:glycerophosphodiester phosphodiesterase [Ignavibacteria bacterium]MBI3364450.1 glycerophosphodiester phosphodiesterase [Ignavibacteriota bacterium]
MIVAHRGSSANAPENTLAAFRRAIHDGADAIELDVRLSKDNELIVFHDSRLDRTSDGSGYVQDATLGELKELSAGSWYNKRFAQERIPTLAEVFEMCGGKVGLNVEIKADRRSRCMAEIVERCCKPIKQYHLKRSVLVTSFHHHFIEYLKERHPGIPGGLLVHPLKHVAGSTVNLAAKLGAEYVIVGSTSLRQYVVRRAHDRTLFVGEFTVNTRRRFERAVRYEVDTIITNDPARMQGFLSSLK